MSNYYRAMNEDFGEETEVWVDRHSVNCYFCGILVDERDCKNADNYNNDDGGSICRKCLFALSSQMIPQTPKQNGEEA